MVSHFSFLIINIRCITVYTGNKTDIKGMVHTLFHQPALSVRIEEGVCKIVPIVFRYLERFLLNAVVQTLKYCKSKINTSVRIGINKALLQGDQSA